MANKEFIPTIDSRGNKMQKGIDPKIAEENNKILSSLNSLVSQIPVNDMPPTAFNVPPIGSKEL